MDLIYGIQYQSKAAALFLDLSIVKQIPHCYTPEPTLAARIAGTRIKKPGNH
jgi:hypothetical protein